jgi:hypothetical protein
MVPCWHANILAYVSKVSVQDGRKDGRTPLGVVVMLTDPRAPVVYVCTSRLARAGEYVPGTIHTA